MDSLVGPPKESVWMNRGLGSVVAFFSLGKEEILKPNIRDL